MTVRKIIVFTVNIALCMSMVSVIRAHDEGHKRPDTLPPIGPHGGSYARLTRHYAEVVVKGKEVTVYILEKDIKNVAEDATRVSVIMKIPGKSQKKLRLVKDKKGGGYRSRIIIPKRTRRVYFIIRCVLDKKWEKGKILYEPRR